jgi:hypothetical protein
MGTGEACWRRPTIPAVTDMLKNPAYAGAFVYGRTRQQPSSLSGRPPHKSPRPAMDWRIVVKDKYPAYICWDAFEKIQIMLRNNRAEYLPNKSRGVPRDGAALLHGITWCGECGHKMFVRYKGGSQYVCNHLRQQHDVPVCQSLRAAPIYAKVAAAFLEASRRRRLMRYHVLARPRGEPMKLCDMCRSSRSSGSAIRPRSPSGSLTVSIRTTGSLPASSSDDGKLLSLNCGTRKKPWHDRGQPLHANPSVLTPACGQRSWLLATGFRHSGRIREHDASIARLCCAA